MELVSWINQNYGIIVLVLLVILFLFGKKIVGYLKTDKKKNEVVIPINAELPQVTTRSTPSLFAPDAGNDLFSEVGNKSALGSIQEQRGLAKKWINYLREEGKNVVKEERDFHIKHKAKLDDINNKKKDLGLKYTTWTNQLKMIDEMIENQILMEENLKQITHPQNK